MNGRVKLLLISSLALAISLPVGFAVAQVVQPTEEVAPELAPVSPDSNASAVAAANAAKEAYAAGDEAALNEDLEAIRQEALSRMMPEEKAAAESASAEASVPKGTLAYIPDEIPAGMRGSCEEHLKQRAEPLCELILAHAEGKLRGGAFSPDQVAEALGAVPEETEGSNR